MNTATQLQSLVQMRQRSILFAVFPLEGAEIFQSARQQVKVSRGPVDCQRSFEMVPRLFLFTKLDVNLAKIVKRVRFPIGKTDRAAEGKSFQWKSIPQGAATSVWTAVVAPADEIGGRYCANCQVAHVVRDGAAVTALSEGVLPYALDPDTAEALWKKSEDLVGESF